MSNLVCSVCKSDKLIKKYNGEIYCNKHYLQMTRFGKIKRTKFDPNEIIQHETYAEVILYDENGDYKDKALISVDKIELVSKYKWYLSTLGYVVSRPKSGAIWMHKLILGVNNDDLVDHIDRNRKNNQTHNLRLATKSENNMNKSLQRNNTSGKTGVLFHSQTGKWAAEIKINRKRIHLGLFETKEEATKVRLDAELKYFGEYSPFYLQNQNEGKE